MKRRDFIAGLGGAVAALPLSARAQGGGVRRVAVLMKRRGRGSGRATPSVQHFNRIACRWAGQKAGTLRIDHRWASGEADRFRQTAAELIQLAPDVVVVAGSSRARRCSGRAARCQLFLFKRSTRSEPDLSQAWHGPAATPPGSCSSNTAWPGNGCSSSREIAPGVNRVGLLRDPATPAGMRGSGRRSRSQPNPTGLELSTLSVLRRAARSSAGIAAFASEPNGGLIVAVGRIRGRQPASDHRKYPQGTACRRFIPIAIWLPMAA